MLFPNCTCCGTAVPCGTCSDSTQYQVVNVTVDLGTTGAAAYGSTPCYNPTCNYCSNFTGLVALTVGTGCGRLVKWSCTGVDFEIDFAIATVGSNVIRTVNVYTYKTLGSPIGPFEVATYQDSSSTATSCDTVTSFTLSRTVLTTDPTCRHCTDASYPSSVTVYLS